MKFPLVEPLCIASVSILISPGATLIAVWSEVSRTPKRGSPTDASFNRKKPLNCGSLARAREHEVQVRRCRRAG